MGITIINTYLRGRGDGLNNNWSDPPWPTWHTSHTACATQQSAWDNNTHLGGGGQWAEIQPIQPSLAISAHLLLGKCVLSWSTNQGTKGNPLMYLRGGGQPLKNWAMSDPPWPEQFTSCRLSQQQSKETHYTHLRGRGNGLNINQSALLGPHSTPLTWRAHSTQQSTWDNNTHLGGRGQQAAIQPI